MRPNSFAGSAPAVEAATATAFALSIALIATFVGKSVWAATKPGTAMRFVVLFYFVTALGCPVAYTIVLWGVGTDDSERGCRVAAFVGIWAYLLVKIGQQAFLAERLHIVYSFHKPRLRSPVLYVMLGVALFSCGCATDITRKFTSNLISPNERCFMGFDLGGTLFILVASGLVDIALTAAFVIPLFRASFHHARALAWRSVLATAVNLLGALGGFLYIPIIGNQVRAWVMWLAVLCDVTVNACVIFAITNLGVPQQEENATMLSGSSRRLSGSCRRRSEAQCWEQGTVQIQLPDLEEWPEEAQKPGIRATGPGSQCSPYELRSCVEAAPHDSLTPT